MVVWWFLGALAVYASYRHGLRRGGADGVLGLGGWIRVLVYTLCAVPGLVLLQSVLHHLGLPPSIASTVGIAAILGLVMLSGHAAASCADDARFRRGARVESRLAQSPDLSSHGQLMIGGIAIPEADEPKHFKCIGTTGTGKSTAIGALLATALARGDRAVIADPDGGYLARTYCAERGDLILNPFDARSAVWQPFAELREPQDPRELARALIGTASGEAAAWNSYAETFLAGLLEQLSRMPGSPVSELYRLLSSAPTSELRAVLAGTAAAPLVESGNERMFGSVRAIAMSRLSALPAIIRQTGPAASVRAWVRDGQGVLYLPYRADQIATLKNLISAWMRLAIFETMTLGESERRLWFIVDELDALGAIDGLKDALARLRKFGGRCVLGFQSIAQVSGTYGEAEARTIVENCATTLILRCSASEGGGTARFASQLIGQREVERLQETRSRADGEVRERISRTRQVALESAVLPAEIEALADLEGYLKVASSPHWHEVRLSVPIRL
jgi:type IV secretory pathway TraG/TraD family ATPase VirD4